MTVGEMRARMSNLEYEDWQNVYRFEHHQREHQAQIAADHA